MVAISIRQPWAEFVIGGRKKIENRTWKSNYRGVLLIHAGRREDSLWKGALEHVKGRVEAEEYLTQKCIGRMGHPIEYPKRALIGAVIMVGCNQGKNDGWGRFGNWWHRYEGAIRFKKPIALAGRRWIFQVEMKASEFDQSDWETLETLENIALSKGLQGVTRNMRICKSTKVKVVENEDVGTTRRLFVA